MMSSGEGVLGGRSVLMVDEKEGTVTVQGMDQKGEGSLTQSGLDPEQMAFSSTNQLGTDDDGRKRWEDEKKGFEEKTLSFVAKLKSVQGERCYSPWKGSMVNAGVGVFLSSGSVNEAVRAASIQEVAEGVKERSTIC